MKVPTLLCSCLLVFHFPSTAAEPETDLAEQMDYFNSAYKSFRREKDPQKGAETAREAQLLIAKTLTVVPDLVQKMPDGPDKLKAAAAYRRMMGQVYFTLCKIEEAYLAADLETVEELRGNLADLKKVGHDQYMEE